MGDERREHPRNPRYIRAAFGFDGISYVGITTDVSVGGAFLNVTALPPLGTVLQVRLTPPDEAEVEMTALVQRLVEPKSRISVVPGVGVAWLQAVEACQPGEAPRTGVLRSALKRMLGLEPRVRNVRGRPVWRPPGEAMDEAPRNRAVRRDLDALRSSMPPVRGPWSPTEPDRRQSRRVGSGVDVTLFVNRTPITGQARNVSSRGLWIDTQDTPPDVGEVATLRYPIAHETGGVSWVRLVGVVVRRDEGRRIGFGLELIRAGDPGQNVLFEEHVEALAKVQKRRGGIFRRREASADNVIVLSRFRR